MQSIEDKILSRVHGHGRGWTFTKIEFVDLGPGATVDSALSRLADRGAIRRIARGLYDYPRFSELLGERLLPDVALVAEALARRYNWQITPDGSTAMHALGLTQQVPARFVYLSSGPNRSYSILGTPLRFRHRKTSHTGIGHRNTAILVQALDALGRDGVTEAHKRHIAGLFSDREFRRMVRTGRTATTWIHDTIKEIANSAGDGEVSR